MVNLFSVTQSATTFLRDVISNIGQKVPFKIFLFYFFLQSVRLQINDKYFIVLFTFYLKLEYCEKHNSCLKEILFYVSITKVSLQCNNFTEIIIQVSVFCLNEEFDSMNIKCKRLFFSKCVGNNFLKFDLKKQIFLSFPAINH